MNDRPVALVTGASRGIGRSIAIELARAGFDIAGNATRLETDHEKPGLTEVEARVGELDGAFLPVPADVSAIENQHQILDAVLAHYGRIDVLVNNAGVAPKIRQDVLETTPESYDRVLSINARAAFFLTQHVAKTFIKQREHGMDFSPCILFISSISAVVSSPSRAEYCVSKAALSMTARIFADRLTEYTIPVHEIRPGIIQTDMTRPVKEKYDGLIEDGLVPLKRWGVPEDIGKAAAALATGAFGYATGLVVELSGGMQIRHL